MQLYYVAPEILLNAEYNEKCDMWSCGVIMYLMIVGHPVFYLGNREDIMRKIKEAKVEYTGKEVVLAEW